MGLIIHDLTLGQGPHFPVIVMSGVTGFVVSEI